MSPSREAASTGLVRFSAGLSAHPESIRAARAAAAQAGEGLDGPADLALLFFSSHHVPEVERVAEIVRLELRPACLLGVSAESVLGGSTELERSPGISVLAARLPGVSLVPFTSDDLMPYAGDTPEDLARFGKVFGASEDLRATLLLADPYSVPLGGILPAMCRARIEGSRGTILGGFASAGTAPGKNVVVLDDLVRLEGAVGVSLRGAVRVETVVSQGCRPIGPNLVVTACRKNLIQKLGGRRALDVLRECLEPLPENDRALAERGVFVGRVVNEYRERFGRGDYLTRNVMGMDERSGAIAAAEIFRVGQTIRFHIPDPATAESDLAMLLDAQQLREPPAGALLITGTGRGTSLFGRSGHDARSVIRAFGPPASGEQLAKAGEAVASQRPAIPLAGFFSSAEIGPGGVDGRDSYVHGHTACLTLFRGPSPTGATPVLSG